MIFDFQSRPRLNRPPLAGRAKLSNFNISKDLQRSIRVRNNLDTLSSNASCDTTIDESFSMCSKEAYSLTNLNISHYSEIMTDNSEAKSLDCLDTADKKENGVEEANHTLMNSTLYQKRRAPTDETKYKTEMCKKWVETNQCPYGRKCKFAHGRHELNEKLINNKSAYRSKKCNSFHTTMTCPYGIRCLFAHEQRQLDELLTTCHYNRFISCPELLGDLHISRRKRLPIFSTMKTNTSSATKSEEREQSPLRGGGYNQNPSRCLYSWGDYEELTELSSAFSTF